MVVCALRWTGIFCGVLPRLMPSAVCSITLTKISGYKLDGYMDTFIVLLMLPTPSKWLAAGGCRQVQTTMSSSLIFIFWEWFMLKWKGEPYKCANWILTRSVYTLFSFFVFCSSLCRKQRTQGFISHTGLTISDTLTLVSHLCYFDRWKTPCWTASVPVGRKLVRGKK